MRRLIVVADDFGADIARNRGIVEALETGLVSSVSVLVNAPGTQDALGHLQRLKGISVGLHLNLSEGKALTPGLKRLVGAHGDFLGKERARVLLRLRKEEDLEEEIRLELEAQLQVIYSMGLRVQFLNGHQHIHLLPIVLTQVLRACEKYGIQWIRFPWEPQPIVTSPEDSSAQKEALVFTSLADTVRNIISSSGLKKPDHFLGLHWKGRITVSLLEQVARHLPRGLTELMVHPGRVPKEGEESFSPFSNRDRETELLALMNPRFKKALEEQGITLVGYKELHG